MLRIPSNSGNRVQIRKQSSFHRGVAKRQRLSWWQQRFFLSLGAVCVFLGYVVNSIYLHSQVGDSHVHVAMHPEPTSPALTKKANRTTRGLPASVLFQRLVKEYEETWRACRNVTSPSIPSNLRKGHRGDELGEPPAFLRALRNVMTARSNETSQETCFLPSSSTPIDNSTGYIVIFPTVTQDIRAIFLHCLKWLWGPAVEIWLLLPEETKSAMRQDVAYGNRILAWNENSNHPVRVVYASTLWKAIEQVDENATTSVSAVFWADETWCGNQGGFQAGLDQWNRNTSALVASRGWQVDRGESLGETFRVENDLSVLVKRGTATICPDESLPTSQHISAVNGTATPSLVRIIGSFHHRDYLCFLNHPVMSAVQASVPHWQEAQFVLAFWLTQVAGDDARLFPSFVMTGGQAPAMGGEHSVYASVEDSLMIGQEDAVVRERLSRLATLFGGIALPASDS